MPIKIPDKLPATAQLRKENIFVMSEKKAMHQDIRPLKIVIVNLMPTKIATETQLLRLLSNSPLQIEINRRRFIESSPVYYSPISPRTTLPIFQRCAAFPAASSLSCGVLNSNDAVCDPQSMHVTYQHQPFSSSSSPAPPQYGQSCNSNFA